MTLGLSAQTPVLAANMHINSAKAARLPLGESGKSISPFPYLFVLSQDDNERIID